MSKTYIRVKVVRVPYGAVWQRLSSIIEDSLAVSCGDSEYEFRTYGDAIEFQEACRDLNVEFTVKDLSDD